LLGGVAALSVTALGACSMVEAVFADLVPPVVAVCPEVGCVVGCVMGCAVGSVVEGAAVGPLVGSGVAGLSVGVVVGSVVGVGSAGEVVVLAVLAVVVAAVAPSSAYTGPTEPTSSSDIVAATVVAVTPRKRKRLMSLIPLGSESGAWRRHSRRFP
jgi:hypothetical protein